MFKQTEYNEQRYKKELYEIGMKVAHFFMDIGPEKYNLEYRDGQYEMACEIIEAVQRNQHLLVEAGVGIGKTFAYLLPLIYINLAFDIPITIATSTIALQEQIKKDIEILNDFVSIRSQVILIKGQNHYVCLRRANIYFEGKKNSLSNDEEGFKRLIENGSQDESEFISSVPTNIWEQINIRKLNKRECNFCNYRGACKYYQNRVKLSNFTGFVLCNQDLLNAHLQLIDSGNTGILNPAKNIIVVDEAHNMESKVRSSTTIMIERKNLLNLISKAEKTVKKEDKNFIQPKYRKVIKCTNGFFHTLYESVNNQINSCEFNIIDAERFEFKGNDNEKKVLFALTKSISDYVEEIELINSLGFTISNYDYETEEIRELAKISNYLDTVVENIDKWLIWIEKIYFKNHENIKFCFCPKNTKEIIKKLYFKGNNLYIFTSATLRNSSNGTLENQYQYFINNTNFPIHENGNIAKAKDSPFLYDKNAMIYYCNDMPHPNKKHQEFIFEGTERMLQLLEISNGKALVLFTAKSDMEEVYSILISKKLPYKILMQSKGTSQEQVINDFKHDVNSVLLGTGAYWEGVSLEGETLSNLIIFRLPFPIPDPIINYKANISNNRLMDVFVPEMIIKLKQGIGRLIRNFTDKGIVSIIDGRLKDEQPTQYRDIVWDSLPIKNRTNDIQKLKIFYQKLYGTCRK